MMWKIAAAAGLARYLRWQRPGAVHIFTEEP